MISLNKVFVKVERAALEPTCRSLFTLQVRYDTMSIGLYTWFPLKNGWEYGAFVNSAERMFSLDLIHWIDWMFYFRVYFRFKENLFKIYE